MEIECFKHQHVDILQGIAGLRKLAHAGIADNTSDIAPAGIANAYIAFSKRWASVKQLSERSDDFRNEANSVLKSLHTCMQRENTEFYPAIDAWKM